MPNSLAIGDLKKIKEKNDLIIIGNDLKMK